VIVQCGLNRNVASTFNNKNFNNSTIQQCSSIPTRRTNHSVHHLMNFASVSEHAQSVLLSIVAWATKRNAFSTIHHQLSTN